MKRLPSKPRENWRQIVEEQGFINAVNKAPDGAETSVYWNESAMYELSSTEVEYLERVTDELHDMCVQACHRMIDDRDVMNRLGLPLSATHLIKESLQNSIAPSVYGRFDLVYDGTGPAKLLEYNADTPAALFEAAVTQWYWLEDVHPNKDQWNLIHERLVQAWRRIGNGLGGKPVHFAVGVREPDEDWVTVAYLRDTAREAEVQERGITMEDIGWDPNRKCFVDIEDVEITTCFKMYPWEWMLKEDFGNYIMADEANTTWIEPAWKTLAGSKAILPVLWEMFPDHENLLPAYFDDPHGMSEYVSKPVYGWEGAGVEVVTNDKTEVEHEKHTTGQQFVFQQYCPLPVFDGNRTVLGAWVINGEASGLGIRESDGLITNVGSRFVPHYIDAPRSSEADIQNWLKEA
jgi:glutathionylspermidine synthase